MLNKSRNWVVFFIAMFLLIFGASIYLLNNSRVSERKARIQKEAELNQKINELFNKEKSLADLNREKKDLEDMLMTKQKELETAGADFAALQTRYESELGDLDMLKNANQELTQKLSQRDSALRDLEQKIQALEGEKSTLTAQLSTLEASSERLTQNDVEEATNALEANEKLLQSGDSVKLGKIIVQKNSGQVVRIRDINSVYGFVVVDAGAKEGLAKDTVINVIRDKQLIARAVIEQVKGNTSAAIILPEWTRDEIRVGDVVSKF